MENTVFLNAAKLDYDQKLDFSPLTKLTTLTNYTSSRDEQILDRIKDQQIVLTKELPLGGSLIADFPSSVKMICEAGTGYNNIDIAAAKARGIIVCNVPDYSTTAVAQLAITFILNLSAAINKQTIMLQKKNFSNFTEHLQVPYFELLGKTLGVIGAGAIGQQVIKIASALGMKVLVYTRTPKESTDPNVQYVSLDAMLSGSDFVTLHCPLTPDTKHLINLDKLKLMKPSAYLINTSRGALIKEPDLIAALQSGEIAGAGLDVQDPEPPGLDNPLFSMENVILTPHMGWKARESRQRLIELMAVNINSFLSGKPINVVNC